MIRRALARNVHPLGSIVNHTATHEAGHASPADLLNSVRQGKSNLGPLLGVYRDRLETLAKQRVSPRLGVRQSPSDIVQETLLHAFRDFQKFRGRSEGELWCWLRQILTHRILGTVRHHMGTAGRDLRREVTVSPTIQSTDNRSAVNAAEHVAANQTSPSGRVVRNEQRHRIRVTVAALPREYRRILLLRIVSEMPFEDIAERLNRSSAAARQLYQRARQAMLARLEQQETQ
ncbi:MAG TPA: RNA polymerase factor sigma-70 [Planctomycetaceae bacterium]|nr:RNA polymerase factor sigma-70 [Planctomycetaceae bacterium]HCC99822.1 RNA polymerase factor sigma-70 [Planctomycetaceae bacterium]|tara:strand:- start:344 stop:1039 length:696 start_codon:yes stop_codon:yes gene_type:complete